MVTNVTSLTGNGLKDWLIQRMTSVYFAVYSVFIFSFILLHPHLTFVEWQQLFHHPLVKILSIIALFMFSLHAWVGIWTVTTDYLKCTAIRLGVQMLVIFWLFVQLAWGLLIMWGQ